MVSTSISPMHCYCGRNVHVLEWRVSNAWEWLGLMEHTYTRYIPTGTHTPFDTNVPITSVRQPATASAAADQASQFRLSNGFEWTFWRSPVKSCCVSFLTVVRNWGQYDRFAPGDFLLFATRLGFSHLVTSRMFTNYHYSALTTRFYRETFADSRAIDPNHVNDTHKQQELSLT